VSALLELSHVAKRFGGVRAVEDVSFSVEPKELVGLIGPNGAGKTTIFNLISGATAPTTGEIYHRGTRISRMGSTRIARRGIARTFQNIRLFRSLTVLDHVLVAQTCRSGGSLSQLLPTRAHAQANEQARELLEIVGLGRRCDQLARYLPYGEQRRLEIARALATSPDLILLDEPAAGLNETETAELRALLKDLRSRGHTILLVEHDMKVVLLVCSRVLVLVFGRLIACGTPAEIRSNPEVINAYLGSAA
jgi:branched-chain amino acid transport system ATP-binding protein